MKHILQKSKNWTDFRNHLEGLSTKEKGDAFELLVKYYLLTSPKYTTQIKNVWLLNEVPGKVANKINLPHPDEGIDLIAETKDGDYWSIQAKYRSDESASLTLLFPETFGTFLSEPPKLT